MKCPGCKGLIVWEPPNPPFPACYRCQNCRRLFNPAEVKKFRKEQSIEPVKEVTKMEEKTEKTKVCTRCKVEKGLSEFAINRARLGGLEGHCKACFIEKRKLKKKNRNVSGRAFPKSAQNIPKNIPTSSEIPVTPELLAAATRLQGILREVLAPVKKAVAEVEERFAL